MGIYLDRGHVSTRGRNNTAFLYAFFSFSFSFSQISTEVLKSSFQQAVQKVGSGKWKHVSRYKLYVIYTYCPDPFIL